jgi:hypothetical protein
LVNGGRKDNRNGYAFLNRDEGTIVRCPTTFDVRGWTGGDLRVDAAPCWNRQSNQILISALAADRDRTRQAFLITIHTD